MSHKRKIISAPHDHAAFDALLETRCHDPFGVLGPHTNGEQTTVRAYMPQATRVFIESFGIELQRYRDTAIFEWSGKRPVLPARYQLTWVDEQAQAHTEYDPYCFPAQLESFDIHLFHEGKHRHAYRFLGAHAVTVEGVAGVLFATWAPGAERVSVVGDFNQWDGRRHMMRVIGGSGIWELFLPGLRVGALYKFEIRNRQSGHVLLKTDPYAGAYEMRPDTASIVTQSDYQWQDEAWLAHRAERAWLHQPMSIYEVHLGSWQAAETADFLNYRTLAHRLVDYVKTMGFTHLELLPIAEHPFDGSWGYQSTGYFAPTSRYGQPDDFRYFVDYCHQHDIGVILDWVPAHFPRDAFGLAHYDGTALYEHENPKKGEHRDWGTLIFNYGRNEVKNFLLTSAVYWVQAFHLDGLRVDAVASMLYLDYSRDAGDWEPNIHGGRENLEAIEFIKALNTLTQEQAPGSMIIAEESTAWPQVTRPTWVGGLGFNMKWNMGWMNDTLDYMHKDPIFRHFHHEQLTFGIMYAFTENFVLPFSHDEVVHGKGSMLSKMPGTGWQKFANLRLLYTYQFTYPGKKLLFMGCEFAQGLEWDENSALQWDLLEHEWHKGMQMLVKDLNHLYVENPALHHADFEPEGFEWIDCHDSPQSILSYMRQWDGRFYLVVLNFTPEIREHYRIGVPQAGHYHEILNSDSEYYGGSNTHNGSGVMASNQPWMGRPYSIEVTLPPLAGLVLAL